MNKIPKHVLLNNLFITLVIAFTTFLIINHSGMTGYSVLDENLSNETIIPSEEVVIPEEPILEENTTIENITDETIIVEQNISVEEPILEENTTIENTTDETIIVEEPSVSEEINANQASVGIQSTNDCNITFNTSWSSASIIANISNAAPYTTFCFDNGTYILDGSINSGAIAIKKNGTTLRSTDDNPEGVLITMSQTGQVNNAKIIGIGGAGIPPLRDITIRSLQLSNSNYINTTASLGQAMIIYQSATGPYVITNLHIINNWLHDPRNPNYPNCVVSSGYSQGISINSMGPGTVIQGNIIEKIINNCFNSSASGTQRARAIYVNGVINTPNDITIEDNIINNVTGGRPQAMFIQRVNGSLTILDNQISNISDVGSPYGSAGIVFDQGNFYRNITNVYFNSNIIGNTIDGTLTAISLGGLITGANVTENIYNDVTYGGILSSTAVSGTGVINSSLCGNIDNGATYMVYPGSTSITGNKFPGASSYDNLSVNISNSGCGSNVTGNASDIQTNGTAITNITIDGTEINSSETYSGEQVVSLLSGSQPIIEFDYDFGGSPLDLSKIKIEQGTNYMIINMSQVLQSGFTKTVYIDSTGFNNLCVKDADVVSINNVSRACNGANETILNQCLHVPGTYTRNGISCTKNGTILKIENLTHTIILSPSPTNLTVCSSGCNYTIIQEAINNSADGDTIQVGAGTYTEGIFINKSITLTGAGRDVTTIQAPASLPTYVHNFETFGVMVMIDTANVNISGFTIDGLNHSNFQSIEGVYFWKENNLEGIQTGSLTDCTVRGIQDNPLGGAQRGNAVRVNHEWDISKPQNITIRNNIIYNYQKTGILINELDSFALVEGNIVTGVGPTATIGQNCIQVGYGASAIIRNNTVSGSYYTGADTTSGILLIGADDVLIEDNEAFENKAGISVTSDDTFGYGGSNDVNITGNEIYDNYIGINFIGTITDNTGAIVNHNDITNSTNYSIFNGNPSQTAIDATENWFGTNNQTIIDSLISGNATYDPWLYEPWPTDRICTAGICGGVASGNVTITGMTLANVTVNGSIINDSAVLTGNNTVGINTGSGSALELEFNFDNADLDLSAINITYGTNSVIVDMNGQLQSGFTKTVYINDNSFTKLCVKDAEVAAISEVTASCNGTNETNFATCIGNSSGVTISGITCKDLGTRIEISNLNHSAILGTPSSSGGGGGGSLLPVVKASCLQKWTCSVWNKCSDDGKQSRTCTLQEDCSQTTTEPTPIRPIESQSCAKPVTASCSDNIKNQNEENVDCGGVCNPCQVQPVQQPVVEQKAPEKVQETSKLDIFTTYLTSNKESIFGILMLSLILVILIGITRLVLVHKPAKKQETVLIAPAPPKMEAVVVQDRSDSILKFDKLYNRIADSLTKNKPDIYTKEYEALIKIYKDISKSHKINDNIKNEIYAELQDLLQKIQNKIR